MNDVFYTSEIFTVNREKLNFTLPVHSCGTKSNYVPLELCICKKSVLSNLNLDLLGNLDLVLVFDCCQTNYYTLVTKNSINLVSCSLVGQLSLWVTDRCWCRVLCCRVILFSAGRYLKAVGSL